MSRKNERTGQEEEEEEEEDSPLFWYDNNKSLQACGVYQLQKKKKWIINKINKIKINKNKN